MSNPFEINSPTDGGVTLTLPWADAEVLTRLVGMSNSGNLQKHSPLLHDFVQQMVEHVGRNNINEANRYATEIRGGQVYISDFLN